MSTGNEQLASDLHMRADGNTVTGFSNAEEGYGDNCVGQKVMPFGQQYSGRKVAQTLIEVVGI